LGGIDRQNRVFFSQHQVALRGRKPVAKIKSSISLRRSNEDAFTRISVYFDACQLGDQMSRDAINSPAEKNESLLLLQTCGAAPTILASKKVAIATKIARRAKHARRKSNADWRRCHIENHFRGIDVIGGPEEY